LWRRRHAAIIRFSSGTLEVIMRRDFLTRSRWRWLAVWDRRSHIVRMTEIDLSDYSVVVKMRASAPAPWKWEIYRAGKSNPIKQSSINYPSAAQAHRAGKEALTQLLDEFCARATA